MAKNVSERIQKQRDARASEGWAEVRVWVPSKSDAEKVQAYAAGLRAKAAALDGIEQLEGIKRMHPGAFQQFKEALAQKGSSAYTNEFGAVATLLSEFARDGLISDFAMACVLLTRGNPNHATSVVQQVPAKILNQYWMRRRGINIDAFFVWEKEHPDWADRLKECVRDPMRFVQLVEEMTSGMERVQPH